MRSRLSTGFVPVLFLVVFLLSFPLWAQDESVITTPEEAVTEQAQNIQETSDDSVIVSPAGEIIDEAICFNVINNAPYRVYGSIMTDKYKTPDGTMAHHRSNFRLDPNELSEFCTYGPFFAGRKLEFTLRTLIPIFSCQTKVGKDIIVYGRYESADKTKTWAVCNP